MEKQTNSPAVYLVLEHYKYEGFSIAGIFTTLEKAKECMSKLDEDADFVEIRKAFLDAGDELNSDILNTIEIKRI